MTSLCRRGRRMVCLPVATGRVAPKRERRAEEVENGAAQLDGKNKIPSHFAARATRSHLRPNGVSVPQVREPACGGITTNGRVHRPITSKNVIRNSSS
jgi:hypothetical protein